AGEGNVLALIERSFLFEGDAWVDAVRAADDPGDARVVGLRAALKTTGMFNVDDNHRAFLDRLLLHRERLRQVATSHNGNRTGTEIHPAMGAAVVNRHGAYRRIQAAHVDFAAHTVAADNRLFVARTTYLQKFRL